MRHNREDFTRRRNGPNI